MAQNSLFHKIVRHIKWLSDSIRDFRRFKKEVCENSYVFISHNADSAGGAPVVLFELMRSLGSEHKMIFLAEKPGKIIDMCHNENIPAFSTYLIQKKYIRALAKKNVSGIVVNTLASYPTVKYINNSDISCSVYWWIHEENNLILYYKKFAPASLKDNVNILCVSEQVRKDMISAFPEFEHRMRIFYYGCKDLYRTDMIRTKQKDNFVITVIGRICRRKNQLQIIEAYKMLPKNLRENITVKFVAASSEADYMKKIEDEIGKDGNIEFVGAVAREDMPSVYLGSDLIVCCSVDDPLPVVVTEAMMLKVPVITSSKTGQYYLIEDGVNGFIYDAASAEALKDAIVKAYNFGDNDTLVNNERQLYLKYFTLEIAKDNFTKFMNEDESNIGENITVQ